MYVCNSERRRRSYHSNSCLLLLLLLRGNDDMSWKLLRQLFTLPLSCLVRHLLGKERPTYYTIQYKRRWKERLERVGESIIKLPRMFYCFFLVLWTQVTWRQRLAMLERALNIDLKLHDRPSGQLPGLGNAFLFWSTLHVPTEQCTDLEPQHSLFNCISFVNRWIFLEVSKCSVKVGVRKCCNPSLVSTYAMNVHDCTRAA